MGCCGQKREVYKEQHHQASVQRMISQQNSIMLFREGVQFEYLGSLAVTIKGTITAKQYKLRFMGDVVLVDSRDVPGIMAEPFMEKVKEK